MPDFRSKLTSALRRVARLLPGDNPVRLALSQGWDRVLMLGGRRYTTVRWAGRSFQLRVPMRRLDPDYEATASTVWAGLLAEGQTVWDLGANVGLYTLLSAKAVGRTGRVVAWEPSPATYAILADHVAANGMADRVQLIQAAVADRRGDSIPFAATETAPTNRIATGTGSSIQVPVETLDGFAADSGTRPDAIKIDIEGAEVLALRGAANILRPGAEPRPLLLVAVHPMFLPEFGCTPTDLVELLDRYEYGCWTLAGTPAQPTDYAEYLFLPRDREEQVIGRLRFAS